MKLKISVFCLFLGLGASSAFAETAKIACGIAISSKVSSLKDLSSPSTFQVSDDLPGTIDIDVEQSIKARIDGSYAKGTLTLKGVIARVDKVDSGWHPLAHASSTNGSLQFGVDPNAEAEGTPSPEGSPKAAATPKKNKALIQIACITLK